jgi:hypothetical protein
MVTEMIVFVIGVSYGVMGLAVLAAFRLKGTCRTPEKPDTTHQCQFEMRHTANEYGAVRCVLDWRIGY